MVHLPVRKCFYVAKVGAVLLIVVSVLAMVERWRGGKRSARAQDLDPEEEEYERQVLADEARIVPGLGEGGVAAVLEGTDKKLGEESEKKLAINVYLSDRVAYNRSLQDEAKKNPEFWQVGFKAALFREIQRLSKKSIKENALNVFLSDMIPYSRTIGDHRNPACKRVVYDAELPSVSVIIIFHNEPYSVVVRTIWSVINSARRDQPWYKKANFVDRETGRTMTLGYPGQSPNSPYVYLKEIILVDDNSTLPELKGKLSHYIRTRMPPNMIRILRLPERVGLTRARLAGARYASADALVFLDAHCEGQPDWLRPLLQRMKDAPNAVVMPIIDVIDSGNMYYSVADTTFFQVGGFNFMGHFTWIDVPEREKKRRGSDIGATWSPTMAGGLFAINREYYWELGAYDEQMAGWGGENLEMSFRIWQCGGTLETIPCSRVGHVFRAFHPYGMPAHTDTHGINTARMAEVWMDDYKELFYLHRPDLRKNPKIGDVTHRKILREKLQCKNFEWYLQHIYKEKFVPVRDAFGYGRFRNVASGLCLDTLQRESDAAPLGVYPCHPTLQGTQYLSLALDGVLRDEERCVQLQYNRESDADSDGARKLLLVSCSKKLKEQKWRYTSNKQLIHVTTGLCLDSGFEAGADVVAKKCRSGAPTQRWEIDYNEHNGFQLSEDREPSEAELTLQKLRGQRNPLRISRSLMSVDSDNSTAVNKIRRHSHKKKHKKSRKHSKAKRTHSKTKNKFILQLVRTLMNNSEDHLEVDIHCKHRQLYPNNSFVRDLVTILNERNIKVINNGRVFERNRVTELVRDPTNMRQTEAKVLKKLEVSQGAPPADNPPPQPQPQPITPIQQEQSAKKIQYLGLNKPISEIARSGPDQPSSINRWLNKKRRLKSAPVPMPAEGISRVNDGEQMVYNQQDANDALADKKIIIEDFVEVKPPPAGTPDPNINQRAQFKRPTKKRKKKQKHHRKTEQQHADQTTDKPEEEHKPKPKLRAKKKQVVSIQHEYDEDAGEKPDSEQRQESVEKITSVASHETKRTQPENVLDGGGKESSEQDEDGHDSEWSTATETPMGDSPRNGSNYRRSNVQRGDIDDSDNGEGTESSAYQPSPDELAQNQNTSSPHFRHEKPPTPLKVVMRSNLTFNLGDEFFKWRSTDDVTDLLGELAIPSNSSRAVPPLHAWVKPARPAPAPQPTARDGGQSFRSDALLTAHGAHQVATKGEGKDKWGGASLQAVDDNSESSSSESEERIDRNNGGGDGFY